LVLGKEENYILENEEEILYSQKKKDIKDL
jgi:hypothetical protein